MESGLRSYQTRYRFVPYPQPPFLHTPAAVEHSQQVFDHLWPAVAAIQPVWSSIGLSSVNDHESSVMARRTHQSPHVPPALPPTSTSPTPTLVPPQVPAPVLVPSWAPQVPIPTFPAPTPAPAPTATPQAAGVDEMKKRVIAHTRHEIVRLMVVECAVPKP